VYFCCLEALQNTAKYASASQARICLQAQGARAAAGAAGCPVGEPSARSRTTSHT
jgi:hypothetical protein